MCVVMVSCWWVLLALLCVFIYLDHHERVAGMAIAILGIKCLEITATLPKIWNQ
jgi:hypothetical protein